MALYEINSENLTKITQTTFEQVGLRERTDLQRLLKKQINVISPDTLIIAEEFGEWEESKRRIDLLGLDKKANLVVIELKRTEDGGFMELQAIRYAAMVSTMTFERVVDIYERYLSRNGDSAKDTRTAILEFLEWEEPDEDLFAQDVRIVLVSANFSKELTTAVMWLNERDLDIRCIRVIPYQDNEKVLIDVQHGLPNELKPENETAKRFDHLLLKLQLAVLQNHKSYEKLKEQVVEIARRLEEKETVPMVKAQMELIEEIQKDDFWQDINLPILENVRKRLRDLIEFIDKNHRQIIETDFEDEIGLAEEVDISGTVSATNLTLYRKKMMHFLNEHENHIALQKLKHNKPITPTDIHELEKILFESGNIGTKEEFEKVYGKQESLGLFIRNLVGLDREEAKQAFNEFLNGQIYSPNQIEFVNMIIDYLTKNGVMDAGLLYKPPYTDYNSNGLSGLFKDDEANSIVRILSAIKQNAAA